MAFGYMKQSGKITAYLYEYVADTEADVAKLPTDIAPGSSCIVISSGNKYMLNNNHQWKLFEKASDSGSGGGSDPSDPGVEGEWGTITGTSSGSEGSSWGTV